MVIVGPSMQSNNNTFFTNELVDSYRKKGMLANISKDNLIEMSIYCTIRKVIEVNWLNNKDLFLNPNNKWKQDIEFQNNCLSFILFDYCNNISNRFGINHWIPFTEQEVNAQERFESHFMTDFINGKIKIEGETNLFGTTLNQNTKREFSAEAQAVFDAGRALWQYYHTQSFPSLQGGVSGGRGGYNVNASLYDIREYFQGRNDKGRMNSKSDDETYMELIGELRNQLNFLADKIKPKIYEYGFLKE